MHYEQIVRGQIALERIERIAAASASATAGRSGEHRRVRQSPGPEPARYARRKAAPELR